MLEKGCVVRSIAGHDKNRFYVIVSTDENRVFIADGRLRKLARPKAKNALHVRPTSTILDLNAVTTDRKLREALAPFQASAKEGGI